ncbi:MAG: sensor histidine kinase, partial [Anaerolinea sp.]|nr:sensor histidine kinase [Anaerolinea sp.]
YNHPGGFVEITSRKKSNQIVIEFQDNGFGISAQQQTHIFERFYRGETGKKNGNGKGLGLAIAAHIITLHNGKIEIESALGNGSTFRIFLHAVDSVK